VKEFFKKVVWVRRIIFSFRWFKAGWGARVRTTEWGAYFKFHKKVERDYAEYLRGKRVVIVGPAPSIAGSGQGARIDAYDVIVRVNDALPLPLNMQEDIGSRTDMLYHNMQGIRQKHQLYRDVPIVCSAFPNRFYFSGGNIEYTRLKPQDQLYRVMPRMRLRKLMRGLASLPNAGLMVMDDLLSFEIKELFITGFSFYKGGVYYEAHKPGEHAQSLKEQTEEVLLPELAHLQERQFDYFCRNVAVDPRVVCDSFLSEIVAKAH
jgi:hypothetical protein